MKLLLPLACLALMAGSALAETWTCRVPYDEVNGGGTATIQADRLVFASNWPHRDPDVQKCTRIGLTSECMSARLTSTRAGGAVAIARLSTIVWQAGGDPISITTRQPKALFGKVGDDFKLIEAFPATAYSIPLIDCVKD